jgi:DNA-binding CsgD family transcriptional regulator
MMDDYDIIWAALDNMPDDLDERIKGLSDSDLRRFADTRFEEESDFDYLRGRYGQVFIDAIVNDPLWELHKELGDWAEEEFKRIQFESDKEKMIRATKGRNPEMDECLTPRQLEVLKLMGLGYTNSGICIELSIVDKTVGKHITEIYRKFFLNGQEDRNAKTDLLNHARRLGLI